MVSPDLVINLHESFFVGTDLSDFGGVESVLESVLEDKCEWNAFSEFMRSC